MYLLVLLVDLTGMQMPHSLLGRSLTLSGSLLTIPLGLGLYFTTKVFQPLTAAIALACRLAEATIGTIATAAGFQSVRNSLDTSALGSLTLQLIAWNKAVSFGALVFTIGSALFFLIFLRSRSLPPLLSWLGLLASLLALFACAAHLISSSFSAMNMIAWTPMLVSEVATGGWLLFRAVPPANPALPVRQDPE